MHYGALTKWPTHHFGQVRFSNLIQKVKRKFTSGPSNGSTGCQLTFWKMYDVCVCTMLLCNFDNFCFSRKQKGTYGFSRRS